VLFLTSSPPCTTRYRRFVYLKVLLAASLVFLLFGCTSTSTPSTFAQQTLVTLKLPILAGSEDVEERSTGAVNFNSSDLELIEDTAPQTVGLRFAVTIPRGSSITKAYLQFTVNEVNTEATTLTVRGENVDNAAAFSGSQGNVSSRAKTQASVVWQPAAWPTKGEATTAQQTPSLAPIIQEIVNRAGWQSGQALVLMITGTGKRVAYSFDGDSTKAPVLVIEYDSGTTSGTNKAPVVSAGSPQTITLPASAVLSGSVTDDGLPSNTLKATWSKVSGLGTVTFANAALLTTAATFSAAGDYVLRLTVSDGQLAGNSDVAIKVQASGSAPGNGNVVFPVRGAFYYPWFPETWSVNGKQVFYTPSLGYYESSSQAVVDAHIKALTYAKVQVGIASWWGVNTHKESERIRLLINRSQALNAPLKWTLYYEKEGNANPSVSELKADLAYIQSNYASSPSYAKVNGKPILFVYNANDMSCEVVSRWLEATAGQWYVVLKVFPGYKTCSSQPGSWHQYAPAAATDQQRGYSYTISPGFWRADEASARLGRDLARWQQNVRDMVASNEPWQLITTFNEWGEGTAVEEAKEWGKTYLDALAGTVSSTPSPTLAVTLSPSSLSLTAGSSTSFTATVSGSSNTGVSWSTTGGSITGTGNTITYQAPATTGSYTLTATSTADSSKKAAATITVTAQTSGTSVTVAAAGDIACDPGSGSFNGGNGNADSCHMKATAALLQAIAPSAVLVLGDAQYEDGSYAKYQQSYALTWGQFKNITYPAVGNHEYLTSGASGYFQYFGSRAGDPSKGYYSFNLGDWHIISLNSNCSQAGGCGAGSAQEKWLRADLAANPSKCTLAYTHHPRFSSGEHGDTTSLSALWQALYDAGAELMLSGHDHSYERFAPQTAAGAADAARGLRQFVVGTGGKSHYPIGTAKPNSEARNGDTYGILKLTLNPTSYSWQFVPEAGKTFTDSGTTNCH
jgi:acid phosphatase type 7